MKKFVSMAMVAAMTTSMVPATAFAGAGEVSATAQIVDAWTMTKDFKEGRIVDATKTVPELQIKITDVNYKKTLTETPTAEVTVTLDNAVMDDTFDPEVNLGIRLSKDALDEGSAEVTAIQNEITVAENALGSDEEGEETGMYKALADAEAALATAVGSDPTVTSKKSDMDTKEEALNDAKDTQTYAANQETSKETAYNNAVTASDNADTAYDDAVAAEALAQAEVGKALENLNAQKTAVYGSATASSSSPEAGSLYKVWSDANTADPTSAATKAAALELFGKEDGTTSDCEADSPYGLLKDAAQKKSAADTALTAATSATSTASSDKSSAASAESAALAAYQTAQTAKTAADKAVTDAQTAYNDAKTAYDNAVKAVAADKAQAVTDAENDIKEQVALIEDLYEDLEKAQNKGGLTGDIEFKDVKIDGKPVKARTAIKDAEELTFTVEGELHKGDVIFVDLVTVMDKTSVGRQATLDVSSDDLNLDVADLVYASIEEYGITAETKKIGNIAEEEYRTLEKDIKVESAVGNFVDGQRFELKLSNGFEFKSFGTKGNYTFSNHDKDEVILTYNQADPAKVMDEFTILAEDIEIESTSAKSGKEAVLTIKAIKDGEGTFKATTKLPIMKVVDYTVMMTVEEDEDVPVIYSGVDVKNYGITDDSEHKSLEVTIEESFPGAWSMRKGFNLELPDGVYVTDVEVLEADNFKQTPAGEAPIDVDTDGFEVEFGKAYREADHKGFEFSKRVFDDVNTELTDEVASVTFQMELVADPGFVGDVNLKFTGDLIDEQEVTIAKFATPYYVTAEQNDLKIDYRYTSVPTEVVITEAEPGLWDKDEAEFTLVMDHADDSFFEFEDAVVSVDEESGMEIKSDVNKGGIYVEMDDDSDDTAAVITISDIEMFMSRSIPAGPYDLEAVTSMAVGNGDGETGYLWQTLFAPDDNDTEDSAVLDVNALNAGKHDAGMKADKDYIAHDCDDCDEEYFVGCVADFSSTVKEAFINVVTAGREQDDASFTTKVVVPVGESYLVAGENQVELDVPAYVSAAGYTMLPVRAVAKALGINNNNVIWNGETKTVTILYGQRIITMVAGQKTVNVNGSVIPASAAVEIVEGRTFLPMRDLATALGVTDITWDAATKTATLNGGVVAE